MKKIFVLIAAILLIPSCSDPNDEDPIVEANVEGTWQLVFFGGTTAVDLDGDGTASANLIAETGCYQDETLVFNSDNTGNSVSTSFADIFILSDSDTNTLSYEVDCVFEDNTDSFTWSIIQGSSVRINLNGQQINAGLIGEEISFIIRDGSVLEVIEGDATVEVTEDLQLVYIKQ